MMMPSTQREGFWSEVWSDPGLAPLMLVHGRIFALTRRNFERALGRHFGPLDGRAVLDFGCGDGLLLERVPCRRRFLYEPSPVYAKALADLACRSTSASVATDPARLPPGSIDLVVLHGVAHYIDPDSLEDWLGTFRTLLAPRGLGVVIADLPHPKRFADALGALLAHPTATAEVARQVWRLWGSRYSWDRLEKHPTDRLAAAAARQGLRLRELASRSFNRARRTVLLELADT